MARSKSKRNNLGRANKCCVCNVITHWFVCIVEEVVCLDCYEGERWHQASAIKAAITKTGGANGSRKRVAPQKSNRSVDNWAESLAATSRSKQNLEL